MYYTSITKKDKISFRILFLGLLLLFSSFSQAQSDKNKDILFIGNSYTYFWNLPHQVNVLAKSQNIDLNAVQSTSGGVTLGHHWRGDRELKTIQMIKDSDFDVIVLQDHSRRALEAPDSLVYFGSLLSEVARKQGAEVLLYMTWAREWDPYMQKVITEEYKRLGQQINARVVPVGLAWERARTLRPELKLYDEDGSHPSSLGSYLSACVFYMVLTGESPVGLPNRLVSKDHAGEKLYLNIQSAETALFCQKVAFEIVDGFGN